MNQRNCVEFVLPAGNIGLPTIGVPVMKREIYQLTITSANKTATWMTGLGLDTGFSLSGDFLLAFCSDIMLG